MIESLSRKTKVAGRRYWGAFLVVEALSTISNSSPMKRAGGGSIRLALKQCHLTKLIHYIFSEWQPSDFMRVMRVRLWLSWIGHGNSSTVTRKLYLARVIIRVKAI